MRFISARRVNPLRLKVQAHPTNLFFDPKRYDLSKVGRYKFTKTCSCQQDWGHVAADNIADARPEVLVEKGQVFRRIAWQSRNPYKYGESSRRQGCKGYWNIPLNTGYITLASEAVLTKGRMMFLPNMKEYPLMKNKNSNETTRIINPKI